MGTRIVKVKEFALEVPMRSKAELRRTIVRAEPTVKVKANAAGLTIAAGKDEVALAASGAAWATPRLTLAADDNAAMLGAVEAAVRAFGGTFVAEVERDGEAQDVRIEAPKGGGEAPAVWAARRVLAEVVKVSSTDTSAALAVISDHPAVTRAEVGTALGGEADRVWEALQREGLVRSGEIPTRGLYIWTLKQA